MQTVNNARDSWNTPLRSLPYAHILQTWEWGDFKQRETGWLPERTPISSAGAASILTRRAGPLRGMDVPTGPALDYTNPDLVNDALAHLEKLARQRRAIWLKIDPDVIAGTGLPAPDAPPYKNTPLRDINHPAGQQVLDILTRRGWRFSASQVQFRNTLTLDLTQTEEALLAAMNQSTRRKIRTATKEGVVVRLASSADDLRTLYDLYTTTGARQGFLIRPLDYYREAWARFMDAGLAQAFLAELPGQALAGLVLFHFGSKAWYFYGMSSNDERQRNAPHLLQWHAILWAKAQGYPVYDFWGAPDEFTESDSMWGVYRFKDGFGGTVVRHIGAWDYVPNRALYSLYERIMPHILGFMKRLAQRGS